MPIVCLAVVGPLNNPAFLQCFPPATQPAAAAGSHPSATTSSVASDSTDRELRLHFIVHCALDAVEDKVRGMPPGLHIPPARPPPLHGCSHAFKLSKTMCAAGPPLPSTLPSMAELEHALQHTLLPPPPHPPPPHTSPHHPRQVSPPSSTLTLVPSLIPVQVLQKRAPLDAYLGLMYPTEEFRVYG